MKPTRTLGARDFAAPRVALPRAPWRAVMAWLLAAPSRQSPATRVDAVDFEDTQPSVRDAGSTLT